MPGDVWTDAASSQGRLGFLFRICMIRNGCSAGIFYVIDILAVVHMMNIWWQINVTLFASVLSLNYSSTLPSRAQSHLGKWACGKKMFCFMWVICFALQTQSGVKNQLDYKKTTPSQICWNSNNYSYISF